MRVDSVAATSWRGSSTASAATAAGGNFGGDFDFGVVFFSFYQKAMALGCCDDGVATGLQFSVGDLLAVGV